MDNIMLDLTGPVTIYQQRPNLDKVPALYGVLSQSPACISQSLEEARSYV